MRAALKLVMSLDDRVLAQHALGEALECSLPERKSSQINFFGEREKWRGATRRPRNAVCVCVGHIVRHCGLEGWGQGLRVQNSTLCQLQLQRNKDFTMSSIYNNLLGLRPKARAQ